MLRSVFGKTLWDQRRVLIGWAIGIGAIGVAYAAFYPSVNTPEMQAALEAYPKGLLDAMGMADIATPVGYLGSTTFGLLGPALVIVMGAAIGSGAVAGDEESGRLDLLLAHPVSRWSVLVGRFAALVVAMLVVCAVLVVALVAISGPAQLSDISPTNIVAAGLQLALLGITYGAIALAIGAATGRRTAAYSTVAVLAVALFLGNNLAPSIDAIAWLRDVSPFHYYSGGVPLRNGFRLADGAVLAGASIVLVAIGGLRFDRRDIGV